MSDQDIPSTFVIVNQGEIASNFPGDGCTGVTFVPPAPPAKWVRVPLGGGYFGVQNVSTGYWITALNGQAVACPEPSPKGQSAWQFLKNPNGTFLVVLKDSRIIWMVWSRGSTTILGLGPAIEGPQNSFEFQEA